MIVVDTKIHVEINFQSVFPVFEVKVQFSHHTIDLANRRIESEKGLVFVLEEKDAEQQKKKRKKAKKAEDKRVT